MREHTIETTTNAAICPLMPLRLRKPESFMISRWEGS
jgi:hypothetical protein